MIKKLTKNKVVFLLFFLFIGLLVHFRSFQMVPYGDDWTFIYDYLAHEKKLQHVNTDYPGLLSFLTPYGPAILIIGLVYQIFGKNYFIYYLIPLIFKVLSTFILFLILQNISLYVKRKNQLVNFFIASLFLMGFTAIQSIDWSMNMNIHVGLFIFALGLFYQSKYYLDKQNLNLFISSFLFTISIVIAPTRFTPLILIAPLLDIVLLVWSRYSLFRILLIKNILFAIFIYLLLQIGIFGEGPGQITNTSLINPFIKTFLIDPQLFFLIFMHWIGITFLPIYPSSDIIKTAIGGSLFLILLVITYYKSKNIWLIIGSIMYFIPLLLMWLSSTALRIEDADSRHLLLPFFLICFLMGVIYISIEKFKKIFVFLFLILIVGHIHLVERTYSHWLSTGRNSDFILPVQEKMMSHFSASISEPKFIFLDFDDRAFQQSVEFGISYRIAVLSGTRGLNLLPTPYSNKDRLIEKIENEISLNRTKEEVINNIYAFQLRKGIFKDITDILRNELIKEI